jgi:hypothetical protein
MRGLDKISCFAMFFRDGFLGWLADNGHVYDAFEREALSWIAAGRTHFSARTIVQEMRDVFGVAECSDSGFRINDHHSPDLARVFAILHPQHAGLWEYRRSDAQAFLRAVYGDMPNPPQRDLFL